MNPCPQSKKQQTYLCKAERREGRVEGEEKEEVEEKVTLRPPKEGEGLEKRVAKTM